MDAARRVVTSSRQDSGGRPFAVFWRNALDRRNRNILIAGLAALVLLVCIGSFSIAGAVTYVLMRDPSEPMVVAVWTQAPTESSGPRPRATPQPTAQQDQPQQEATRLPDQVPPLQSGGANALPAEAEYFTERMLADTIVPTRDLRDLAMRLKPGIDDIPLVVNEHSPDYEVGERIRFWAANVDDNDHFPIMAELIHKTDVAYAWVEVDRPHDAEAISRSVDSFSEIAYETVRAFFGSEWKPGVDNDPRLHILHATNLGDSIAGYYSSADQFSSLANEFSNEKEMFYISLSWLNNTRDYEYYETVLAHEFQHMVHWANDRNEETWVNEGLSELAQEIAGYPPDTGFASLFLEVPDTQLNTWSDNPAGNGEHYGSAYLFMAYFLQRFGPEMTQAVVAHPANGIAGFDEALAEAGHPERFEDIFADWVVANYLDDPGALGTDGLYGYVEIELPQPAEDKVYRRYPIDTRRTTVQNYAWSSEGGETSRLSFRERRKLAWPTCNPTAAVSCGGAIGPTIPTAASPGFLTCARWPQPPCWTWRFPCGGTSRMTTTTVTSWSAWTARSGRSYPASALPLKIPAATVSVTATRARAHRQGAVRPSGWPNAST
jgi:hypothetical protein